jgi:DNA-binding transcriptional LysR family regulator
MQFHRLDLNLLIVLDALLSDQSVSRAAKRLRVTQPAISLSLRKLRAFFEDELFIRTAAGMRPTAYAEHLRESVRRAIELIDVEIVKPRKFDPATTKRNFRICTSDAGEVAFLPAILARLREHAPDAAVHCVSLPPDRLSTAMESGEVDIAIGYFPDLITANFYRQRLHEDPFVCLVRADHPIIRDTISVEQFLEVGHAIVSHEGREQDVFEKLMIEMRLKRRIQVRLAHLLSVPILIATSDLIAIVPRAVAAPYANLSELKLIEPPVKIPPIELKQYWHGRVHHEPAIVWLRTLVADQFLGKIQSVRPDSHVFNRPRALRSKVPRKRH